MDSFSEGLTFNFCDQWLGEETAGPQTKATFLPLCIKIIKNYPQLIQLRPGCPAVLRVLSHSGQQPGQTQRPWPHFLALQLPGDHRVTKSGDASKDRRAGNSDLESSQAFSEVSIKRLPRFPDFQILQTSHKVEKIFNGGLRKDCSLQKKFPGSGIKNAVIKN